MACQSQRTSPKTWNVITTAFILACIPLSNALAISYCSPDNNAGPYSAQYSEFMSNGYCQTTCQGSFVFAVIQGNYCWCSNYIPSDQTNTINCNQDCPGFQSEWCGSTDAGLYAYFNLGGTALGTSGGSSQAPSSTTQPVSTTPSSPGKSSHSPSSIHSSTTTTFSTSSPKPSPTTTPIASVVTVVPPQSSVQTSTSTVETSSTVPIPVSSASTSSTTQSSTLVVSTTAAVSPTPYPSSADTPSPTTAPTTAAPTSIETRVTTVTGIVKTILVTPTATADPTLGEGAKNSGGVSTGKVVGIVLGVALGLGLIIGLGVFFWLRRKHANNRRGLSPDGSVYHNSATDPNRMIPSRQVSQISSSNLLTRGTSVQGRSLGPSNTTKSAETVSSGHDRRSLGTDQRLNPNALYIHDEGRFSNLSLQDNHDYSRQLRVANPDP